MYDVCIIGAGVIGTSIARELSRFSVRIVLVEKAEDVSQGASKANSGIVHGGYSAPHGTLKGDLCAQGNRMYTAWNEELHFGVRRIGSLVLAFDAEDEAAIEALYENGKKNGAEGLELIDAARVRSLEPNVNRAVTGALRCTSAGVTSPYELVIALAENAVANGVELRLGAQVTGISLGADAFHVEHTGGSLDAAFVVNAAGVYGDVIAAMVGAANFRITPRRGEYMLFERGYGDLVKSVIFQTPTKKGKGVLVTQTFHRNLLIGPNAEETSDRESVATNEEALREVAETARRSVPEFDLRKVITSFSGLRATPDQKDFIIEESSVPRFINVAGIESPGLTASPAIARRVRDILKNAGLSVRPNAGFSPQRPAIIVPKDLSPDEVKRRVALEDSPERLVCRCEQVSEAEILDARSRGIPVDTTDAVKRRTRAGMGQCQGTFCRPRVKALLARELGRSADEVRVRADETAVSDRPKRAFFAGLAKEYESKSEREKQKPVEAGHRGS